MNIGTLIQKITTRNLHHFGTFVGTYTKARNAWGRYDGHYILRDRNGNHIGIAYNENWAIARLVEWSK